MSTSTEYSFLAPAKLNVTLKVYGRRADGFHDIRSVMVPVSLYDMVTVSHSDSGIRVESDDPAVPVDGANICHRAASVFMDWAGTPEGVRIVLRKRIPVEAGLGGGSSDAAATFKGMMALTGRFPSPEELLDMAARVGADVPFFTRGVPAVAEGIGERLTPIEWRVSFHALIVMPPFGLSTREGYARLRRREGGGPPRGASFAFRDWDDLVPAVSNDFEDAWGDTHPGIGEIKKELLSAGARAAGLSGSGSAVFGLFGSAEEAGSALGTLSRNGGRRIYVAHNI